MNDIYVFENRDSCYQSQKTQTLDQIENDNYMNMILADISTQTPLSSFSTGYSQTGDKVWIIYKIFFLLLIEII